MVFTCHLFSMLPARSRKHKHAYLMRDLYASISHRGPYYYNIISLHWTALTILSNWVTVMLKQEFSMEAHKKQW